VYLGTPTHHSPRITRKQNGKRQACAPWLVARAGPFLSASLTVNYRLAAPALPPPSWTCRLGQYLGTNKITKHGEGAQEPRAKGSGPWSPVKVPGTAPLAGVG
jgi:hypothetical protein